MRKITKRNVYLLSIFCSLLIFANPATAQETYYDYKYRLDLTGATEAPKLGGMPDINMPDAARKNGVEGTLKAEMTLAKDGKVRDVKFSQTLPHGVEQAVIDAYQTLNFSPATRNGTPIDVKLFLEYTISAVYDERDKNVQKPKITSQPDAVYPAEHLADKRKDEVEVGVLFYKDGTVKVLSVSSSMPKEFDKAAVEAAGKIKFEPAVHKKSKQPVSLKMFVKYKFKP